MTPFKTIALIYHCVPSWLLSRTYDLIFALCNQLTPFKTIWPNFIIVYPIDFFQDPFDPIYNMYPLTPFKTIFAGWLCSAYDQSSLTKIKGVYFLLIWARAYWYKKYSPPKQVKKTKKMFEFWVYVRFGVKEF